MVFLRRRAVNLSGMETLKNEVHGDTPPETKEKWLDQWVLYGLTIAAGSLYGSMLYSI